MLTRPRIDFKAVKARHVQQVQRAKQVITDAAFELLHRQFRAAARELRQTGVAKLGSIFRASDWHQLLKGAVGGALFRVMLVGVATELKRHGRLRDRKASSASDYLARLGIDTDFATELPPELVDSIQAALADSFRRPYWEQVNVTTANQIEDILRRGSVEGLSIRDMAREIEDQGETFSRQRATVIAKTESSRSLNAAHVQAIDYTERETGERLGKTWVSVLGNTTRASHAEADGQTVATNEPFYVGGYACMFPGDADLPPEESVNCLCAVISGAGDF